jgi:hypothetical protein
MINHTSEPAKCFWKDGRIKDCPIINFHGHMFPHTRLYLPVCMPEDYLKEDDLKRMAQYPDVFPSFKIHGDYSQIPMDDKRHQPYYEYANQKGLLVLAHTWSTSRFNGHDVVENVIKSAACIKAKYYLQTPMDVLKLI